MEDFNENQITENEPQADSITPESSGNEKVFNRINYSDQKPISNYSPFSRGLKLFCLALATVILLSGALCTGYFIGKSGKGAGLYRNNVSLNLASKPKDADGMTAAEVYKAVNPSIVGVRVYNSTAAFDASGVIYTEDGYIITNDHIYSEVGAPKFKIYTFDGKEYDAEYVAGDTVSDLAVLKIKNVKGLSVAEFGNSDELVCGENVFSVGRPSDATDDTSITAGTVSLPSRRVKSKTNYASRLIQTDSAINPGSSGGALVNMYGQVVGVTSSKLAGTNYDAISFSIPSVTVKRVIEQLISNGKVTDRAKLGITYTEIDSVTKEQENRMGTGLLVVSVNSDSDLYNKVSKDDIITEINGIKITKDEIVLDIIESLKPGDFVTLAVLTKSGDENEIKARLGANIGESSFSLDESKAITDSSNSNDGTFDFPFGE